MTFLSRRRDRDDAERAANDLRWAWRNACLGSGLCNSVQTVSGPTDTVPRVSNIELARPPC